jgi:uncharacterized protein YuzE
MGHHFVIDPKKAVGPIPFGSSKDAVSHAFTYVYRSFFKTSESKVRSDHIEVVGLIVHYDEKALVHYIEITAPKYSKVTLELWGHDVTGITMKRAFDLLRSRSANFTRNAYGYEFPDLGLSLYSDQAESEDDPVECIGVSP